MECGGEKMDFNKIIIILVIILAIVVVGGLYFTSTHNTNSTPPVNNTTGNASVNVTVEQVNTEEVKSSDSRSGGNTHTVIGEDGCYYLVDDSGNILQSLGPSKKYYPNGYGGKDPVQYPNAEPMNKYVDKSK